MTFFVYKYLLICVLFLAGMAVVSCQHLERQPSSESNTDSQSAKDLAKKHFKSVSKEERAQIISRAHLFNPEITENNISNIEHPALLFTKRCPTQFNYKPESLGQWPQVTCIYQPDINKELSGTNSKYNCLFQDTDKNETGADHSKVYKVKYAENQQKPLSSEMIETVFTSQLAQLIGFYSETYCPAEIVCEKCASSNPWHRADHSSLAKPKYLPAFSNSYNFPWAVVEKKINSMKVSENIPQASNANPQGIRFSELKLVDTSLPPDQQKALLIEREAYMLWLNFLQHFDSSNFNQFISCKKFKTKKNSENSEAATAQIECNDAIIYLHDFGETFALHMNFEAWKKLAVFSSETSDGCRANLQKTDTAQELIVKPVISQEAQQILFRRLSAVTDNQWQELIQFSRLEEASQGKYKNNEVIQIIKDKIVELGAGKCLPFDEGKSILFPGS